MTTEATESPAPVTEWWREQGYLAGKEIGGDLWICLAPMIVTFRLMICDTGGVHEFFCYPDLADALMAFAAWDGTGDPLDGWVKHHPSMRRNPPPRVRVDITALAGILRA